MYSLNVPVPPAVRRQAETFRPILHQSMRDEYTLVAKRLDTTDDPRTAIEKRVRNALTAATPFDAATAGVDQFPTPTTGTGTVLYLTINSPGLTTIHDHLCDVIPPDTSVESSAYTPHITLGRTDDDATIDTVLNRDPDPITWTVSTLEFYDAATNTTHGHIHLSN